MLIAVQKVVKHLASELCVTLWAQNQDDVCINFDFCMLPKALQATESEVVFVLPQQWAIFQDVITIMCMEVEHLYYMDDSLDLVSMVMPHMYHQSVHWL